MGIVKTGATFYCDWNAEKSYRKAGEMFTSRQQGKSKGIFHSRTSEQK